MIYIEIKKQRDYMGERITFFFFLRISSIVSFFYLSQYISLYPYISQKIIHLSVVKAVGINSTVEQFLLTIKLFFSSILLIVLVQNISCRVHVTQHILKWQRSISQIVVFTKLSSLQKICT